MAPSPSDPASRFFRHYTTWKQQVTFYVTRAKDLGKTLVQDQNNNPRDLEGNTFTLQEAADFAVLKMVEAFRTQQTSHAKGDALGLAKDGDVESKVAEYQLRMTVLSNGDFLAEYRKQQHDVARVI